MNRIKSKAHFSVFIAVLLFSWKAAFASAPANRTELRPELPPMACNDLVHVSLDTLCHATLTPAMLLEDMIGLPYDYAIEVYYSNGVKQADIEFDHTDIHKTYGYKIWHLPTGNSCWGKVYIEDKYPPQMQCHNDTIRCGKSIAPEDLGFPIPGWLSVSLYATGPNSYHVDGWDYCGYVNLSYTDQQINNTCDSDYIRKIIRVWRASDSLGNTSYCSDTICVIKPTSRDIVIPPNFDDFDKPHLNCDLNFPKLADGNPSPDLTGWPVPKTCNTLTASYTDLKIPICGNAFKVLRRWIILDWCSGKIVEHNQIIKVVDDTAPKFDCPADMTMGMEVYTCGSYGKLPVPTGVIDCNKWNYDVFTKVENPVFGLPDIVSKQYIDFDPTKNIFYLIGAPQGRIWIVYQLTDDCGNTSSCTMEVGVVDDLAPIPVCDQKTVVALGADGTSKVFAETFDDGSLDNCGIEKFLVRRMEDTCKSGTNVFGPYVQFCCEDVGKTVLVAFEVIDFYGNRNTCMVEATVQDKEPPVIIPPTDITIHCDFPVDYNNMNVFGRLQARDADRQPIIIPDSYYANKNYVAGLDGWAYDNCEVKIAERIEKNIQCNSGTIKRIFEATDRQGLVTVRYQTITLINTKPFTRADIKWPASVEIHSCNNVVTHPDNTGYPEYLNTTCAQVAANYDDLKLTVLDSTCYKILRKWVVIDWCQYDRNTGAGIWDTTQIIVVKSSEPPVLETCNAVDFCDTYAFYDGNTKKCLGSYALTGKGYDDCTDEQDLIWAYRIDENNDGTFDSPRQGNAANGVLPLGTHRLRWILTDQCGNSSSCDQVFTIRDCKKPTPYCINGIVTVVMQTNGSVTVWAKDLNLASFDNCTRPERLRYSFSPDTNNQSITYNCDSMQKQSVVTKIVRVYVTDEYGNQDYCETSIRIQDNNHVCPGTTPPGFNLAGAVHRENTDAIPGAQVQISDRNDQTLDQQNTDQNGSYTFLDLQYQDFYVHTSKNDDITNGVSTMDIVLIQRHILGLKPLNSPYKLLAADVNNSNSITAKDISDLRRAILGIITEWPNQTQTWKFVKADQVFANPAQPWNPKTRIESNELTDVLDQLNFLGIKTGDVDLSADVNANKDALNRVAMQWTVKYNLITTADNRIELQFIAGSDFVLDGLQFGIRMLPPDLRFTGTLDGILSLDKDQYVWQNGSFKLSWAPERKRMVLQGERLFTLQFESAPASTVHSGIEMLNGFRSEAYSKDEAFQIVLDPMQEEAGALRKMTVQGLVPNPFAVSTVLHYRMPEAGLSAIKIYDPTGKEVFAQERWSQKGDNQWSISSRECKVKGLLFVVLSSDYGVVTERMIVSE